jgi:hypothetical protein
MKIQNYKSQNTNYKQITNYKLQITNKLAAKAREETLRATKDKTFNSKSSHGLHRDSFKLKTMTALMKSFCRGVQGGRFFQKESPLAAGGKRSNK